MEYPRWEKRLKGLLASIGRVIRTSKYVVLGAGVFALPSGKSQPLPNIPAKELVLSSAEISKYSKKYLLKSAAAGPLFSESLQHRSHSSHSSHRSHASHYSGAASPPSPAPTTVPPTTLQPSGVVREDFSDLTKWRPGVLSAGAVAFDSLVLVSQGTDTGHIEITPRSGMSGLHYNGYVSTVPRILTGSHVSVEVVEAAKGSAATVFAFVEDSNNWHRFLVEKGILELQSNTNGVKSSASVPFNPQQHRFWRFRHDAANGLIIWETSPDEVTWSVRHATTANMPATGLRVELTAGTSQPEREPGKAVFKNFRLVTPNN